MRLHSSASALLGEPDSQASDLCDDVVDLDSQLVSLLAGICNGQQSSLALFYDLCVDRVFSIAQRILANSADAEEVCCEVFQQVWEKASRFDAQRGGALAWLGTMAWSRSIDRLRRERIRHQRLHPDSDLASYSDCEDDIALRMIESLQTQSAVRAALAGLGPAQQRMVALAFLEDLSHAEIAERTGTPVGTVKSHIRRGLDNLRRSLHDGAGAND